MEDYCAGDISTEEADVLIKFIDEKLGSDKFKFYTGVGYRHCLIWDNGTVSGMKLIPPHNITNMPVKDSLDAGENGRVIIDLMKQSYELLKEHPLNLQRIKDGKRPANSIWLWGEGTRAKLEPFTSKTGLKGAMISAVDLLKGIGMFAGMEVIKVKGATGYLDTNFDGKVCAALDTLKQNDFVYIHIEAPDECGHRGDAAGKVKAIELIDEKILGKLLQELKGTDFRILICPDHPTLLRTKTHTNAPVPYLIYDSRVNLTGEKICFNEENAKKGEYVERGYELIDKLIEN
jgi:2,3-bisphosphoglycerate-independent phosphoglycerate mutase